MTNMTNVNLNMEYAKGVLDCFAKLEEMAVEYEHDSSAWYGFAQTEEDEKRKNLYQQFQMDCSTKAHVLLKAMERIMNLDTDRYAYIVMDNEVRAIEI